MFAFRIDDEDDDDDDDVISFVLEMTSMGFV